MKTKTLRPDSKHCLPFPTAPDGLDAWIEVDGKPGAVVERRKDGKLAKGTVKVKAGARILLRYGDFRKTKPNSSYVTGLTVDGEELCNLITSKSDQFWRKPMDDVSRVGTAYDPKTNWTMSYKFSSDPSSTMTVKVSMWRISNLDRNSYNLVDTADKPYSVVEFRLVADSAPPSFAAPPSASDLRLTKVRKPASSKKTYSTQDRSSASSSTSSNRLSRSSTSPDKAETPHPPSTPASSSSTLLGSSPPVPLKKLTDIDAAGSDQEGEAEEKKVRGSAEDTALEREEEMLRLELRQIEIKRRLAEVEEEKQRRKKRRLDGV